MASEPAEDHGDASSAVFDRWIGKASENIDEWGLQDEEKLLLTIQEELGELTQALLEARYEGGDESLIADELDDLGALLLQFHEARLEEVEADGDDDGEPFYCPWCEALIVIEGELVTSEADVYWHAYDHREKGKHAAVVMEAFERLDTVETEQHNVSPPTTEVNDA